MQLKPGEHKIECNVSYKQKNGITKDLQKKAKINLGIEKLLFEKVIVEEKDKASAVLIDEDNISSPSGDKLDPQSLFKKVNNSVFLVISGDSMGTAFSIGPHALLTNRHIIEDSNQTYILNKDFGRNKR